MCAPWDTTCIVNGVATAVSNTVFGQISMMITTAEQWLIDTTATWWVMVPSISLYPNANNQDPNAAPIDAVAHLHALIMPITAVIAIGGMLWNGLLMVLSRKPAPLVNVMRGLWNTALWSAVGIFGTNLLLYGCDKFSSAVITWALRSVGDPSLGKRLSTLLVPVAGPGGLPVGMVVLIGGIAMICSFIQAVLMLFREGSVLVLAAITPLAASGSFTNATNGWLRKVVSWQLALMFYKPFASMVYATSIWLQGENTSTDPRVLLMGVAMMGVSLLALPVLLRFFNWTVGSLQSGGGGLGMLAAAAAGGMHAGATMRGASGGGGRSVNDHARYMSEVFERRSSGGSTPSGSGGGSAPGPGPMRPPMFTGPAASGAAGGAGAGAAGGASSAAMGASAATGPAAPVVAGAVAVVSTAAQTAHNAANAAANATSDSTKGA